MAKKPGLGERSCPKCKETIKADALICKHCRTEFSAAEVAAAKKEHRQVIGVAVLGLVLLLGFCSYINGDETPADNASTSAAVTATNPAPETPAESVEQSLLFTPEQFAARFNALATEADKPWRISNIQVTKNSFKYMLSDHLGFIGDVGSDGQVKGLVLLGSGDGTLDSGMNVFMAMAITYCAATDTTDLKRCGPPMLELSNSFKDGGDATETISNNMKISFSRSDAVGSIMTVGPV